MSQDFRLRPLDPQGLSHPPVEQPTYIQQRVKRRWPKKLLLNIAFLAVCAVVALFHKSIVDFTKFTVRAIAFTLEPKPESFHTEVQGVPHSLRGYINNLPCAALEQSPDSVIVRNGRIGEQALNLYKNNDPTGYQDDQYTLVLADIKEWAFMKEGSYLVVSQPYDTTQTADSCLIRVDIIMPLSNIDYVDSE